MIGRGIEFEVVSNGEVILRKANVKSIEFHPVLGPVFTAITPFGNQVRLTKREIKRVLQRSLYKATSI